MSIEELAAIGIIVDRPLPDLEGMDCTVLEVEELNFQSEEDAE